MLTNCVDFNIGLQVWPNLSYRGARSVKKCTNLTYFPTTVVVAVAVNGFLSENFCFSPPYTVMASIGPGGVIT